jgi:hypothetical protein
MADGARGDRSCVGALDACVATAVAERLVETAGTAVVPDPEVRAEIRRGGMELAPDVRVPQEYRGQRDRDPAHEHDRSTEPGGHRSRASHPRDEDRCEAERVLAREAEKPETMPPASDRETLVRATTSRSKATRSTSSVLFWTMPSKKIAGPYAARSNPATRPAVRSNHCWPASVSAAHARLPAIACTARTVAVVPPTRNTTPRR